MARNTLLQQIHLNYSLTLRKMNRSRINTSVHPCNISYTKSYVAFDLILLTCCTLHVYFHPRSYRPHYICKRVMET